MTGTVKKYVSERGFGFITAENGQEFFFHKSAVDPTVEYLAEGTRVDFDAEDAAQSPKGPRAKFVRAAD